MRWLVIPLALALSSPGLAPAQEEDEDLYAPVRGDDDLDGEATEDLYGPVESGAVAPIADANASPGVIGAGAPETSGGSELSFDLGFTELDLKFGGGIESYLHYRVERITAGEFYNRQVLGDGFSRNENTLNLEINATAGRFCAVADIDLDWLAHFETVANLRDLALHQRIDPVRVEAQALYLEAVDLFTAGLDLRIGQQVIAWGVGDQFNPTNTVNPSDLDNILLFGKQVGNFMVRADYGFAGEWSISLVAVPVFKPAVTPATGALALTNPSRLPFVDAPLRHRLHSEKTLAARLGLPTVVDQVAVRLPAADASNIQGALRIAGTLAEQDIALSYYFGRTDFPQAIANHVRQDASRLCDPDQPSRCTLGLLATDVTLGYPRLHVIGLNATGEIPLAWITPKLAGIGYRFELGVYIPKRRYIELTQDEIDVEIMKEPAGEYDYDGDGLPGGPRPLVVDDRPFLKWVLGVDYSFGSHVYLNTMWVHGMVDEYGAGDWLLDGWAVRGGGAAAATDADLMACYQSGDGARCAEETLRRRQGDYLVIGVDLKFFEGAGYLRLFTIWDLGGIWVERPDLAQNGRVRTHYPFTTEEGFSAVLYPELSYNFGNGFQLACGALIQLGREYTKFGDPAAGGHLVWARARFEL